METFKSAKLDDCNCDLSKSWFVHYSYLHPETGQYTRFKKYISNKLKTKAERYNKATELTKKINNWLKSGGNPFQVTAQFSKVSDAMDYVYNIKKASCRKRSYQSYCSVKDKFQEWLRKSKYSNITVEEFGFYHAQKFMDSILTSQKLTNRTYNNHLQYMRIFFNTLVQREYIVISPFSKVKPFPKTQTEIRNFTPAEMVKIRTNLPIDNNGLWLACQFIYYCFIRPGELVKVQIGDINLQKNEIYIRPEISKNRKGSSILIPDAFVRDLTDQGLFKNPKTDYIFSQKLKPGARMLSQNAISKIWRVWAKDNTITKDLYDFKHTGVGKALDNGININDLRMQLRHQSLEVTQAYLEKFRSQPGEKLRMSFPSF